MTSAALTALRRHIGMTRRQMATKLAVSPNTIARWEMPGKGDRFPIPEAVAQLLRIWASLRADRPAPP